MENFRNTFSGENRARRGHGGQTNIRGDQGRGHWREERSRRGGSEGRGGRGTNNNWRTSNQNSENTENSTCNPRRNDRHRRSDEDRQTTRKPRQMGYKFLHELVKNDDLEDVVFILNNEKKGFKELLQSKDVSSDVIVLLVKLLRRVCECSFVSSKISLLDAAMNSSFAENVTKFIATLAIQNEREKQFNSHFWKDPDEFWNNVINISRNVHDVIPMSSCQATFRLLKAMKLYIPVIENNHSIHVSDEIKATIENLCDIVEKTSLENERKREIGKFQLESMEIEPPDDFREINILPSAFEITQPDSPFLRPNIIEGPYQNVHQYLDIQFRLLREDFVAPLRKGICRYLKNSKDRLEDIRIYKPIKFLNIEMVTDQNCFRIQYDFSKQKRTFQFENSRKFMFGSLLCFTNNNFKSVLFGKIVQRDVKDLEKGQLIIGFNEDVTLPENLYDQQYLMVESTVYFEPYYQVLRVLKSMSQDNFPMESYIIRVETVTRPPEYLLGINPHFYTIQNDNFWPLAWGGRRFYGLNDAQHLAFQAALTREFAIIQGPPGTGKTFLGLKIARTLLENRSGWYKNTPMLVICFTNHALDQFLEGLLEVTDKVLRVGSQSKNLKLNDYNLRSRKNRMHSNATVIQMRHQVQSCISTISTINDTLNQVEMNSSILDFRIFADVIPNYKDSWFHTATEDAILDWLFGGRGIRKQHTQITQQIDQVGYDVRNLDLAKEEAEPIEEETMDIQNDIIEDLYEDIKITKTRELVTIRGLADKLRILQGELLIVRSNNNLTQWDRMTQEEDLNFELYRTDDDLEYLKMRLYEGIRNGERYAPPYVDLKKPHNMPADYRWQLYFHWLQHYTKKLREKKEALNFEFKRLYKVYNEMRDMEDTQVMKHALVIGMTTTGAARLQSSLQTLKSPIVIVEEAAEVLEAHIISALTSHCKHLILIGDHQQLKPSTANFKVQTKYRLGISLFERMVINNIQCHTLNIQHRMRPEISCLIRPSIYPILEDHESVLNRLPILGLEKCVYFIDHNEKEELCKDNSKKNTHEAKFLILLAKHLILNGYKPENITILAAYLGQMFEMQREKLQHKLLLQDVRIAVLDNYQGEESDIILLSLVRCNDENKIGFLKIENRVCVALSRAKCGLFIMGNMTQLCNNSEIWPKIKHSLEKQEALGPYLTLRCQIHRHKITQVRSAEDFSKFPEGGCELLCETQIACGHICKRLCHVEDRAHAQYNCREKCTNVLCNKSTHICLKMCFEDCGPCTYPVQHELDCGHSVVISCYIDPNTYSCMTSVNTKLPCGHETEKPCHSDPETFKCPHPCDTRVEPCGHACKRTCHINDDPDHLEYKCSKPCAKFCIGCNVKMGDKHLCRRMCYQKCMECEVGVKKRRTVCSHVYTIACKLNPDEIDCEKPCTKTMACGHPCKNKCNQPCGNCNKMVTKTVSGCNHEVKIKCSEEPDRKFCAGVCPRLLACGHKCVRKCNQDCVKHCRVKVDCAILSPCGHTIKKIMCYKKETVDPNTLLQLCSEKCTFDLKCKHRCSGTCGGCFQGRIHQRCSEKCGVPLVCDHECPVPCRQACRPCTKDCEYRCFHNKCNRKCGDPCVMCKERCQRKCTHQRCSRKCGEMCDIPPCYKKCTKKLHCGHPCVGFCGDPCPKLCLICDKEELTTVFLGREDEPDSIFVMLEDCGHTFESMDLEQWLKLEEDKVKPRVCPRCNTKIKTTQRYSEYIKVNMDDIQKVKSQYFGTRYKNEEQKHILLSGLTFMKAQARQKIPASTDVYSTLEVLYNRLLESKTVKNQRRRQQINKRDLDTISAKKQILELIINIFKKGTSVNSKSASIEEMNTMFCSDKSVKQINFIITALMREEDITDQEIQDISLEVERLTRLIQFETIQKSVNYSYNLTTKPEVSKRAQKITEILDSHMRYSEEKDNILQTELEELNKITASSVAITETERRQIVSALNLSQGHWFKCPNGHLYIITECGGANQISNCNECGVQIGGTGHRLLPDQQLAPEMDGARFAAWSEAANLANYGLNMF